MDWGGRESLSISTCELFKRKKEHPAGWDMGITRLSKDYMAFLGIKKNKITESIRKFKCFIVTIKLSMEGNVSKHCINGTHEF